jgi:hypothetical protein
MQTILNVLDRRNSTFTCLLSAMLEVSASEDWQAPLQPVNLYSKLLLLRTNIHGSTPQDT